MELDTADLSRTPPLPSLGKPRREARSDRVLLTCMQALVQLPLMQRALDVKRGLNTAGFISGYRGSPLGGYDQQLWKAKDLLADANVIFEPGVNEELAATAVWGTQQVGLVPGAKVDGVFSLWYGKGPGVDRAGDALKHGNRMGTSPYGGVLVVCGDDHVAKSSTVSHQSEHHLVAASIPILVPSTVQECLDYGLHGWALSRYSGLWVGLKLVNETAETTATVNVSADRLRVDSPGDRTSTDVDVHARMSYDPLGNEVRVTRYKLPMVQAYVRANRLDRVTHGLEGPRDGLGIVATGKAWLDVVEALKLLGLHDGRAAAVGVAVYKPALVWPIDSEQLVAFARGRRELLFVEEKAGFIEPQAALALFNMAASERPQISGKSDACGGSLLPADLPLDPYELARAIGARLEALGLTDFELKSALSRLARPPVTPQRAKVVRAPYFCSGCPHNSSTKVPAGSLAFAGIGCHGMALLMNRSTLPPTHMGGEGLNWAGIAPFSNLDHVFQNLGDGTYFHSGLLAIRAAVAARLNITYKILVNDAVAMTGGQPVEGHLSVAQITHQLRAERVTRIAVVSDDILKYGSRPAFAAGVTVHHRTELESVQNELREVHGVSAIVYDQVCAAEKRRRRKRGQLADPDRRVFINELVCEGCGDCSVQSNCVSIEPVETPLGRKRRIDQSSCNKDYSCIGGFCPSFVTVEGARLRKPAEKRLPAELIGMLTAPSRSNEVSPVSILVTGIGGTGVVTVGAVLAMAAHLDGFSVTAFDMTGLAQKGGAVFSHLRIAPQDALLGAPRIGLSGADVILGCDLVVTASAEALRTVDPGRTRVILNTHLVPTGEFQQKPDIDFQETDLLGTIVQAAGEPHTLALDATTAMLRVFGDTLATNMFLVGFALQTGLLPVRLQTLERAIELNGTAVALNKQALTLGRLAADQPIAFASFVSETIAPEARREPESYDELVAQREAFLIDYQNDAYARRYRSFVDRVLRIECERTRKPAELATAVARNYFKLLAYKDEYEVARLHTMHQFRSELASVFEDGYRIRYQLAPPLLARTDPLTGQPRKMEFGSWMGSVFKVLARLKGLRGTSIDPFGYTVERRLDRQLIKDYEARIEMILSGLNDERHALAVELARLPEQIRGFGHVRARNVAAARKGECKLTAEWRAVLVPPNQEVTQLGAAPNKQA